MESVHLDDKEFPPLNLERERKAGRANFIRGALNDALNNQSATVKPKRNKKLEDAKAAQKKAQDAVQKRLDSIVRETNQEKAQRSRSKESQSSSKERRKGPGPKEKVERMMKAIKTGTDESDRKKALEAEWQQAKLRRSRSKNGQGGSKGFKHRTFERIEISVREIEAESH